jgi:hypothetical protein
LKRRQRRQPINAANKNLADLASGGKTLLTALTVLTR